MDVTPLEIDWARIATIDEFYDSVLSAMQAPGWHGRNLDALADSWVTGSICPNGPPYHFVFLNRRLGDEPIAAFAFRVLGIAHESVQENGGSVRDDAV